MRLTRALLGFLVLLLAALPAIGQMNVGIVAGTGVDNSMGRYSGSTQIVGQLGMGGPGVGMTGAAEQKVANGFFMEAGYVGSWRKPSAGSAVFSVNWFGSWMATKRIAPFVTAGLGCLCGDGFAVNYGAGVDFLLHEKESGYDQAGAAFRVEVRDYFEPSIVPMRHSAALRIGLVGYVDD